MAMNARVGIIGGNGWLGNAIAQAAVATGAVDPARLTLRAGRTIAVPRRSRARTGPATIEELVDRSDVVLLSVRPEQYPGVDIAARGKLVVSVMAGVPARVIAERTGAHEWSVRCRTRRRASSGPSPRGMRPRPSRREQAARPSAIRGLRRGRRGAARGPYRLLRRDDGLGRGLPGAALPGLIDARGGTGPAA